MESNWTVEESKNVLSDVLRRAAVDGDFRNRCLSNASEVIKEISGKDVPKDFSLTFAEPTAGAEPTKGAQILLPPLDKGGASVDHSLETAFTAGSCTTCCGAWSTVKPTSVLTG